jgi:hypothetical protein
MASTRLAVLFCFVLFFSTVNAQVHVLISPKTGKGIQTLYLDEVFEYNLIVANLGTEAVNDLIVEVRVDEPLILIKDNRVVEKLRFELNEVKPGEKIIEQFKVKPTTLKTKENRIYAYYGVKEFSNVDSTYLLVQENPVQINARLSKTALDLSESGSLLVSLKNTSKDELKNISASLIVSEGLISESEPLLFGSLAPRQGFSDKEFVFTPLAGVTGKKEVTLRLIYDDSKGRHQIEKTFLVDIQNRNLTLYLIVGVVVLLIVLSYAIGRKPRKPVEPAFQPLKEEEKPVSVEKKEI